MHQLDDDTRQVLLRAGEDGEAVVKALADSGRDEAGACASALRLLRDRPSLKRPRENYHPKEKEKAKGFVAM